MARRLAIDRPIAPHEAPKPGPLRRLWRHFLAVTLDGKALERLSPHERRDIGLTDLDLPGHRPGRDRFRDLL